MKTLLTLSFVILLVISLTGCKKTELEGQYAIYEGYWSSSSENMTLYGNGRADYASYQGSTQKTISGGRLVINKGELKIVAGFLKVSFKIDSPPSTSQNSGFTTMTLDGKEFYKY
jgi:hypothetical protein